MSMEVFRKIEALHSEGFCMLPFFLNEGTCINLSGVSECATRRRLREASGCLLKVLSKTLGSILKASAVCFYKSYSASRKGVMKLNQETK